MEPNSVQFIWKEVMEMPSEKTQELIEKGREFIRFDEPDEDAIEPSDQQKKLPQPPLVKAKMTDSQIDLPMDFNSLALKNDILALIYKRISHRIYTEEKMTLRELSYLLWATQGIKSIRGNNYVTMRTVPCGGARHEFETYLSVKNVEGLTPGMYHYLPMTNQIEYLSEIKEYGQAVNDALVGQKWAEKANVIFFWSVVPYRAEWRYSFFAHRIILVDIGHVCQNLYVACESLGLGTCAVGAFDRQVCDRMIGLDGKDEFTILCSPVGTVPEPDIDREQAYQNFLNEGNH